MSANKAELVTDGDDGSLADQLDAIADFAGAVLRVEEVETIERAVTVLRDDHEAQGAEYPLAEHALEMQKRAILLSAAADRDSAVFAEAQAALEHTERALLALAAEERAGVYASEVAGDG